MAQFMAHFCVICERCFCSTISNFFHVYYYLISYPMIFLVQFGINKHLYIFFQRLQSALARLLVFDTIYSCLFIPNCTRNHGISHINWRKRGPRARHHACRCPRDTQMNHSCGFHLTSTPLCLWTETKDLVSCYCSSTSVIHYNIVSLVPTDWLQTTCSFYHSSVICKPCMQNLQDQLFPPNAN